MIATPGHPLYKKLISRLHLFNHYFLFHFWTILISAGPVYVSIQERLFSSTSQRDTVRILDYDVFQPMFISKAKGHTWIGRDASFLFYISAKSDYILYFFKVFTIGLIILLLIRWYRVKQNNSSSFYLPLSKKSVQESVFNLKKLFLSYKISKR